MRYQVLVISLFVISVGCVEEDFFGLSEFGRIRAIEMSSQASKTVIKDDQTVNVPFPLGVDLSAVVVRSLELSSFATADIAVGDTLDMTDEVVVEIRAEDGTIYNWTLIPEVAGSEPQLPNSDFNTWYQTPGGYLEPGESASNTIWGTSNPGTQILNLLAVLPYEASEGNRAVYMETLYNGDLAAAFGTPISTGSIYVGKFNTENVDPGDPNAAIDFGTPFAARPSAFRLDYTYSAGEENKDKRGNLLGYPDQLDIYLLLEIRTDTKTERLATGWFRSDEVVANPRSMEVTMFYGPLDSSFPEYMFPEGHTFVSADSAEFVLPTHLTFVAASSFDGANFAGAVGSVLTIDNLELIYE